MNMNAQDPSQGFIHLDNGDIQEYVEFRLFDKKIDSLSAHIDRKKALAEPTRYSILYLLYEYGSISRKRLANETGRTGNQLHHHLDDLLEANLIGEIPAPPGADGRQTYYEITTLGKHEIAADIENILGAEQEAEARFSCLIDSELSEDTSIDDDSRSPTIEINEAEESGELTTHWNGLREKRESLEQASFANDQ